MTDIRFPLRQCGISEKENRADFFQRDALDLANRVRLAKLRYRED